MDPELGNPDWIASARSFVSNLPAGATGDALALLAPGVAFRVLGHHALSGAFSGRDEVAKHLRAIVDQTDGRIDPVSFEDWMLGLSHVSVLVGINAMVGGAAQRLRLLILMRFDINDLIDEVIVFFSDPEVAERLFGHLLRDGPSWREAGR